MALAMAKQSRGYQIHLDCNTLEEVNENKSKEEKKNFDSIQITMKEKTYLHWCHP